MLSFIAAFSNTKLFAQILQIVYMKNCNLRSRGLVRNLYDFSPAKQSPGHEYSRTSLYGHPLNTNTSFNRQFSSSLGKCPYIFSKFNPLNTDTRNADNGHLFPTQSSDSHTKSNSLCCIRHFLLL